MTLGYVLTIIPVVKLGMEADLFDLTLKQRVSSQFPLSPQVRWIIFWCRETLVLQTLIYEKMLNTVLSRRFFLTLSIVLTIPEVVALSSICLPCQSDSIGGTTWSKPREQHRRRVHKTHFGQSTFCNHRRMFTKLELSIKYGQYQVCTIVSVATERFLWMILRLCIFENVAGMKADLFGSLTEARDQRLALWTFTVVPFQHIVDETEIVSCSRLTCPCGAVCVKKIPEACSLDFHGSANPAHHGCYPIEQQIHRAP